MVKFEKSYDFKMTVTLIMFVFSIIGSVSSYFMAMSDIRQQIQTSMYEQAEKLREEMRSQYATKEQLSAQKELLEDIKVSLREIKHTLNASVKKI